MNHIKKTILLTLLIWCTTTLGLPSNLGIRNSTQLMVVEIGSPTSINGSLQRFHRTTTKSCWQKVGKPLPVKIGRKRTIVTRKIPLGIFSISTTFGISKDGCKLTKMPYLHISPNTLCIDDPNSKFYNQIVNGAEISNPDWKTQKKLFIHKRSYNLGLVIGNNKNHITPNNKSCIFIRTWKDHTHPFQKGMAMAETNLKEVLAWLKPSSNPIIEITLVSRKRKNETSCQQAISTIVRG